MSGTEARFQNAQAPGEGELYGALMGLNNGFSSVARFGAQQQATTGTQILNLTYFKAPRYLHGVAAKVYTGSTAAAATPTLVRYGLWTSDITTGALLALVASTPNDTTLFAGTNLGYSKNWSTPYDFIKGQYYAVGILIVTAAAVPTLFGVGGANGFVVNNTVPRVASSASGQADLPATLAAGSLGAATSSPRFYVEFS